MVPAPGCTIIVSNCNAGFPSDHSFHTEPASLRALPPRSSPLLPLCRGSANSSSLPHCSGTFPTLQVLGAQVPSVRLSLAKLQPSLQKTILGNLGRSVINLQLVGGERREC